MSRLDLSRLESLVPAETSSFAAPIPTQSVSSDEFTPPPQTEIPEEMQKKYGFQALGAADGPTKPAIFGENSARL